ncbi:hypothetical protein GCK32_005034 [Trichostrongylus colubriformis]|uniref:Uncharacterized protein n=1 Tax=Trichostrongylus colubriformis TaxID=6319 RepID=A0AAN8J0G4_TRICO
MSDVFRRRRPDGSSRAYSRMIVDDRPIGPSDYQMQAHVFREPAGMDPTFDGARHGSVHSMCPVHGSTHSIWRPVRHDSRESRIIFESGYRSDCPVHRPPPSICSVHSMGGPAAEPPSLCSLHSMGAHTAIAPSGCSLHSQSTHTAILYEDEVVTVPSEPLAEPVKHSDSEGPPYEEPPRPPTPAPELQRGVIGEEGELVQRVIQPELPDESPRHPSWASSFVKTSRSRQSRSRSRSRPRSQSRSRSLTRSRRPSTRVSQYTVRSDGRSLRSCSSSSYSTGVWSRGDGYSCKSLITTLKEFYEKYPRLATALAIITFLYFFIHQLDATLAHIFECFIRIIYPAGHYIAVTNEQVFAGLARMATRSDEMMEAFYCDIAKTWCQRFELMCEVRCSFVEQTLQRIRKHPH